MCNLFLNQHIDILQKTITYTFQKLKDATAKFNLNQRINLMDSLNLYQY